jgi:hypothetical protein
MTIAHRATATAQPYSTTSWVVGKPTGLEVGDLMLAWLGIDNTTNPASVTPPSGFSSAVAYGSGYLGAYLYWKIAEAADVAASDFTFTLASAKTGLVSLAAFSGTHQTAPTVDSGAYGASSTTNAPAYDLSISTTTDDQVLVMFGQAQVGGHSFSSHAVASQNPSSWSEAFDISNAYSSGCMAYGTASGTGSTGNWSYLCSGTVRQCIVGVAIKAPSDPGAASGALTAAAAQVSGALYAPPKLAGGLTTAPAAAAGAISTTMHAAGVMRTARAQVSGTILVTPYGGGDYSLAGSLTIAAAEVRGFLRVLDVYGHVPLPEPPAGSPVWPPVTPNPALTSGEHTLIGNIHIAIGGVDFTPFIDVDSALRWESNVSGGYGPCSFRMSPPCPVPANGEEIAITSPWGDLYHGEVVNQPEKVYTGEFITYEVVCDGPAKDHNKVEDFSWVGSDSDVTETWAQLDCQNWNSTPGTAGFEITMNTGNGIGFQSADIEEGTVAVYRTPPGTSGAAEYTGYRGNTLPPPVTGASEGRGTYSADCPAPPVLWAAFYARAGKGVTDERWSGLRAKARYNLATPTADSGGGDSAALMRDDVTDGTRRVLSWRDLDWAIADFPQITEWEFYGIDPPGSLWAGLYAVDDPRTLPVRDPIAMLTDEHLLYRWGPGDQGTAGQANTAAAVYRKVDPVTGETMVPGTPGYDAGEYVFDEYGNPVLESAAAEETISLACDATLLVFYSTFAVLQLPFSSSHGWEDPLETYGDVRDEPPEWMYWRACNQMFTEGSQYVELREVKALANDHDPGAGDLTAMIAAASGGGEIAQLTAAEGQDVKIDPFATRLAAIQRGVGMSAERLYWGWDPSFFCVPVRGTYTVDATIPGVRCEANVRAEGTIETARVVYTEPMNDIDDRRVLAAWVPTSKAFDIDGDEVSDLPTTSALVDASQTVHSAAGAAPVAQSYIIERGTTGDGPEWEGTITLEGIEGACAMKVAYEVDVTGPEVDVQGAVITRMAVDAGSDTVTLSLGGTGYLDRFQARPGQPYSAAPSNAFLQRPPLPYATRRR